MDEQLIFTTHATGSVANIHSFEQTNLRQCTVGHKNSAVYVGNQYLFIAQGQKALINVYNLSGPHKRESVEQRLPLPEAVNCLEVVESNDNYNYNVNSQENIHELGNFNLPYLLLGSTQSGKLYIWELNSGFLLNVKPMAHYQSITKIKSIMNGKYIITSGNDSRVIIWQTVDLITLEDPKPIAILHDHTLPVTDFVVSGSQNGNLFTSGLKLFTSSKDTTLRCYDLNLYGSKDKKNIFNEPTLIATFTMSEPINTLALDPADRAVYLGTDKGCYQLPLYYKLNGNSNQIINLLQLNNNNNKGKLYSLVKDTYENNNNNNNSDKKTLYGMGQLIITKIIDECEVSVLNISMDGTIITIGDNLGKILITEIFSKQILKTLQPLTTSQVSHGGVTNILIKAYDSNDDSRLTIGNNSNNSQRQSNHLQQKIPSLQRAVFDQRKPGQLHEIWYQIGEEQQTENNSVIISPLTDYEQYLEQMCQQESVFDINMGNVAVTDSTSSTTAEAAAAVPPQAQEDTAALKEQIATLTKAYQELRALHEDLYQQQQQQQQ